MTLAETGKAAVPGLCKALEDDRTRYWAILTLGEIGPEAADAAEPLAKMLSHPHVEVRTQAAVALGEIGAAAKSQVAVLSEHLASDPANSVRYAAAYALGMIGDKASAEKSLLVALNDDDPFLRVAGSWRC